MLYNLLFLIRYFPFWSIPCALVIFEVGLYYYNRRERLGFMPMFALSFVMIVLSILWLIFEGYWRAGPFVKKWLETF